MQIVRAAAAAAASALLSMLASSGLSINSELRDAIVGVVTSLVVLAMVIRRPGGRG